MSPETASTKRLDDLRIDRSAAPARGSGRAWLKVIAALIVGAAALGFAWSQRAPAAVLVRTAAVEDARAGGAGGGTVLNATGYVTARRQATVSSKVTARVVEVLIEEGMEVAEGQVLARLDASNVDVSLRLAEAQLTAAEGTLAETRALLREAELDLQRTRELVAREVQSEADRDRAEADHDSLAARLVRQRAEVEVARRQVGVWRQHREDTIVRAPFAGVVVAKNAQPGEMISPAAAGGGFTRTGIGTIVDMTSLEIEVDVNESYINRVRARQPVEATLDAYPDWAIPAYVIAIIPTADRQRATVAVRIGFTELDARILPDMGVKVAFQEAGAEANEGAPALPLAPRAAVRRDGDREVVFVVRDGRVERRAITLGERRGDRVQIVAGLTPGDRVVLAGPETLTDGDAVEEVK